MISANEARKKTNERLGIIQKEVAKAIEDWEPTLETWILETINRGEKTLNKVMPMRSLIKEYTKSHVDELLKQLTVRCENLGYKTEITANLFMDTISIELVW